MKLCFHVYKADREMGASEFQYVETVYADSCSAVEERLKARYKTSAGLLSKMWVLPSVHTHLYPAQHIQDAEAGRSATVAPKTLSKASVTVL